MLVSMGLLRLHCIIIKFAVNYYKITMKFYEQISNMPFPDNPQHIITMKQIFPYTILFQIAHTISACQ